MILVTGAAGKTGQAVTRALVRVGASVRALVHKEEYQDSVESAGVSEIYLGDLLNLDDLQEIMEGVEAVYHICPNVHPGGYWGRGQSGCQRSRGRAFCVPLGFTSPD